MADRTTTCTKRGGARRNAGRHQVHTPGKQNSLWLGTGDKSGRVLKRFQEEKNRLKMKHNCEFLDHLLRLQGTTQQNCVPTTTSFIQPGANDRYGRKHTDSETDVNLTLLTLSENVGSAATPHNGDATTHGDCPPESTDLGLPNTGELFPDAWQFETMDIGTLMAQFDAVEMGSPEGGLLQSNTFESQQAEDVFPPTIPACVQGADSFPEGQFISCGSQCTAAIPAPTIPSDLQARPTMMELLKFSGQHRTVNIPQEIGPGWMRFGILLLEDGTGASVISMNTKHSGDTEGLNIEILQEWLTGRGKQPVTWKTLTNTLRDAGLTVLASDIEAVKLYTY